MEDLTAFTHTSQLTISLTGVHGKTGKRCQAFLGKMVYSLFLLLAQAMLIHESVRGTHKPSGKEKMVNITKWHGKVRSNRSLP